MPKITAGHAAGAHQARQKMIVPEVRGLSDSEYIPNLTLAIRVRKAKVFALTLTAFL
jgi:hypothetical protein